MENVTYLIKNAYIVTMDKERRIIPDGCIAVHGDRIKAVGDGSILKQYQGERTIDAKGKVVFPGFVDTHLHMFQTTLKGVGRDKKLWDWLEASVFPCLHRMDGEVCYAAAIIGCMESIHSGASTVLDYMYAHAVPGTDDYVIQAMEDIGIRGVFGRIHGDTRRFKPECNITHHESEQDFFDDARRIHNRLKGHGRLSACLGPGIIFDMTEEGLVEMRRVADETGMFITMHLLESEHDDDYCLKKNGMRCTPYLDKIGVLGPDFLAVHCVVVTEEDIAYFKAHDVKVSYNPLSNMILASGVAPIIRMQEAGITVGLACDGAASNDTQDMIEVLKAAALLQKVHTKDASVMTASNVLEMATLNGARCVGLEEDIGSIEVGKKADMVFYNPLRARSVPVYDPVSSLVYASGHENMEAMMIDGRMIMENSRILTVDEEKAIYTMQKIAMKLGDDLGIGNTQWGKRVPNFSV